jgi:dienelactone hydrolase
MLRHLPRSAALLLAALACGAGPKADDLAAGLRALDGRVLAEADGRMLGRSVQARLQAVNRRDSEAWDALRSRADWEEYRDARLKALRESLGPMPAVPQDLRLRVTGTVAGEGYRIDNLVFVRRPGLVVTANLYRPEPARKAMPGILICHSHHNPKTQGELQDMGVMWARAGCLVLVPDQAGHGERRQHPFTDARSYPAPFRPGRQDYYFRYNLGLQLSVTGDSLMGWMAWDLMRCVDVLLSRPGIDRGRIILLGAVAGGGDPAAVTAALDARIAAVAPFNFGGPQPETAYPLPPGRTFAYAGSGSWESTRNLRLSARDGFLPWLIVAAVAPRRLVYGHEFSWDREHDPVWARLEQVYRWYDASPRLASAHGRGKLSGKPPEASHCNNIGPLQREGIHLALKRWFDVAATDAEPRRRHAADELTCLTPAVVRELKPRPVHEIAAVLGAERAAAARRRLADLAPAQRRRRLRQDWARLLGTVEPPGDPRVTRSATQRCGEVVVERISLEVEPGIVVPLVLLIPPRKEGARPPVVVAVAQGGKQSFLENRAEALAGLLGGGAAVCLPDVRGTGETRPGDGRGRTSAATALASSEWMLGQTLVGGRLRDLRSVLRFLRGRADVDGRRTVLWGDSFAAVNPKDRNPAVPLDAAKLPDHAEPLGGLLALLGGLFEEDVRAVCACGGLTGYHALLQSPFCYVPADSVVPAALTAGDLCDVAAALAPRPLRLAGLVDGLNREVPADVLRNAYEPARAAYRSAGAQERLDIASTAAPRDAGWRWLLEQVWRR